MKRRVIAALVLSASCAVIGSEARAQNTSQENAAAAAARMRQDREQAREILNRVQARLAASTQQFSIVLIVSSVLTDPPTDNIPPHARKALEDMKAFLPFKSYRLFGTTEITQQPGRFATARITGGDNQTFEITMVRQMGWSDSNGANGGAARPPLSLTFILKDVTGKPDPSASDAGVVMNTLVTMEVGETIVVGTSRVGGSRGLLALLTALPPAAPNGR